MKWAPLAMDICTIEVRYFGAAMIDILIDWCVLITSAKYLTIFLGKDCRLILRNKHKVLIVYVLSGVCPFSHLYFTPLLCRHNGRDSVSNYQLRDCLLNRLFNRRPRKTSKHQVIHRERVNSPHKRPVTRKISSFDDVIMRYVTMCVFGLLITLCTYLSVKSLKWIFATYISPSGRCSFLKVGEWVTRCARLIRNNARLQWPLCFSNGVATVLH